MPPLTPEQAAELGLPAPTKRLSGAEAEALGLPPADPLAKWLGPKTGEGPQGVVSELAGLGETALALGSGAVAYPAGLLAAGVNLARGKGMDSARKQREAVQGGLTYEPRTQAGKEQLATVAGGMGPWTKTAEGVGRAVGEATGMPTLGGIAEESFGAVVNPLAAAGITKGLLGPKAAPVAAPKAGLLRRTAESAAVRATNADRTAFRRAFKGSTQAAHETGAFLLDEKLPLRSPAGIKEAAQGIAKEAGNEIGTLAKSADQSGAAVDLAAAVNAAKSHPSVARLSKNTVTRAKFDEIAGMLDDQVATNGGKVPPSVAHDIRMQIDELANWDQAAPKGVVRAWRAARDAVDAQLGDTMKAAGMGDQWAKANSRFSQARKLSNPKTSRGLADIGAERRAANRFGQPSEKAAALLGGLGAAGGNPAALLIPPATIALNRGFFPVTARTLNLASRLTGPAPALENPAVAAALARALAGEQAPTLGIPPLRFRLQGAAADEEDQ